jgi:alanyl-tRNA synthetase
LRFDVSQPTPIGRDDLLAVEAEVNARIRENSVVETRLMTPDEAINEGAMALFGEKYGDEVRVVSMGLGDAERRAWSIELCGGTHVVRTGEIGLFRIISENAVSAGVRRIEAVTGEAALASVLETERRLHDAALALRASPADVPERVAALIEDRRRLERQIAELHHKLATSGDAVPLEQIDGVTLAARNLGGVPPRDLKSMAETIGKQMGSGVVALLSTAEDKASIVVRVSPDITTRFSAVDLVRIASVALGGKGGGGRPDLAQAGGKFPEKLPQAMADALEYLRAKL